MTTSNLREQNFFATKCTAMYRLCNQKFFDYKAKELSPSSIVILQNVRKFSNVVLVDFGDVSKESPGGHFKLEFVAVAIQYQAAILFGGDLEMILL
jgi:hypothetical protein